MSKAKKFKLVKVFLMILYFLIVVLYAGLVFGKYLFNDSRSDFNFLGKSFYVLETNDAALVNYELKPNEGDTVVVKMNNVVSLATLNFEIDRKTFVLSLDGYGKENYVTVSSSNVFFVENVIHSLGSVYLFLSSIWGCLAVVILPCSLFLIIEIVQIVKLSKNKNSLKNVDSVDETTSNLVDDKLKDKNSNNNNINEIDQNNSEEDIDEDIEKNFTDDILKDIEYKVNFQDTHQLQNTHRLNDRIDGSINIDENSEFNLSKKYGLGTKNIEDGIELVVSPECINNLKLVLKIDGSLTITTDKYTANIDLDI